MDRERPDFKVCSRSPCPGDGVRTRQAQGAGLKLIVAEGLCFWQVRSVSIPILSRMTERRIDTHMVKALPASYAPPGLSLQDLGILWVGKLKGVTPTLREILLTLFREFEVNRNAHGPGCAINASRRQLCKAAGISKGTLVNLWAKIQTIIEIDSGDVSGDHNTWIFPEVGGPWGGSKIDLGQKLTQVKNRPRSKIDHKSKESSSPVFGSLIEKKNHHHPTPPMSEEGADDDLALPKKSGKDAGTQKAGTPSVEDLRARSERDAYAERIRALYTELPGRSPKLKPRLSHSERQLCFDWYNRRLPTKVIELALWTGYGRNIKARDDPPPEIHSITYFANVVEDVLQNVVPIARNLELITQLTKGSVLQVFEGRSNG